MGNSSYCSLKVKVFTDSCDIVCLLLTDIMLDNEMLVDRYPDQPQCSPFEASSSLAMPSIPKGGVLVRVSNLLFNRKIFQIVKFKSF